MSASSKKKLRKEQNAAAMTEKQLSAAKEAKKLKVYTVTFVVVLALIVGIALGVGVTQTVKNSGIIEKNTAAVTIGNHELSNAELNYYYVDAINSFYSNLTSNGSSYASTLAMLYYGLDLSSPLNEQVYDEEKGLSWADYFVELAITNAKSTYAMYDKAVADGHKLSEEEEESLTTTMSNMAAYAMLYGYDNTEQYLKAMYGAGSEDETFEEYMRVSAIVSSYYTAHQESLEYTNEDFREYEKDKYDDYTSYTYAYYYLSRDKFLPELDSGDEDSTSSTSATHSEEDKAQALEDAKAAADTLAGKTYENTDKFDEAIKLLPINKDNSSAASTKQEDIFYPSLNELFKEWLSSDERKAGDITVIENATTTKNEDGTETKTVSGYYVIYFQEADENLVKLPTVRHILFQFEGGSYNSSTGETTYTDDEKKAAKDEATKILGQYKAGKRTEESFIELAKKYSDDSSAEDGGLIEEILPGYTVDNFDAWIYDESRQSGDVDMIMTEYGYHLMYYVEASDMTYRDYLIETDLITEAMEKWNNEIVEAVTVTEHNTKYLDRDLVISAG